MSRALIAGAFALAALVGVFVLRSDSRGDGPAASSNASDAATSKEVASSNDKPVGQTAVERALAETAAFDFVDAPLSRVVAMIADRHKIGVLLDTKVLEDAGIVPETLFTATIKGISLRSALYFALREKDLAYLAKDDDTLLITTADVAKTRPTMRFYDVRHFSDSGSEVVSEPQSWGELPNVITATIAPSSWDSFGGLGTLSIFDGTMIVSQSEDVHGQVANLLAALETARKREIAATPATDTAPIPLIEKASPEARIDRALDGRLDLLFADTPLREIVDQLAAKLGVCVRLDTKALADVGITGDSPLSIRLKQIKARVGLAELLAVKDLSFVIDHEVLLITTADVAKVKTVTEVYPVGDLVARSDAAGLDYDSLIDAITTTVDPSSWDTAGGPGSIAVFPPCNALVFRQTKDVHRQVQDLFARLRAAKKAYPAEAAGATNQPVVRIYSVFRVGRGGPADEKTGQQIVDMVRKVVEPKCWSEPDSYIGAVGDAIVVRQMPEVHRQIQEMLSQLGVGNVVTHSVTGIQTTRATSGGGFGGGAAF